MKPLTKPPTAVPINGSAVSGSVNASFKPAAPAFPSILNLSKKVIFFPSDCNCLALFTI